MMNQLLMSVLAQRKSVPVTAENYVRFVSAEARTITPKYTNTGITLQYSVDSGATWTTISSGSETTSAKEHWFRGQATGTKSLFASYGDKWVFNGISDLEVYGNLNFLLCDTLGDEVAPTSLGNYCYSNVFNGCKSLTVAPELPATTLGNYCYYNMFYNCTSLTTAPELPATTLASNCYYNMFNGCTSLTTAPELPATTLADTCYFYMFKNCTSLTTAPKLPATTLTSSCYGSMFRDCTSLTAAPELPATILERSCYSHMFQNCTAFKVSETNTGSYTYAWRIPTSGTGAEASGWNSSMLTNTGGTFTSDPTINTTYYVENEPVDEYFYYAKDYYTITNNSTLFSNAWEHSLTVDPSEIERESTSETRYGTLQYPNGEVNGVIIPNSVTSIGQYAFYYWEANNQPLVIPNSVTSIGDRAFNNWTSNNQPLVIPNSVTSIGGNAFRNWKSNNQPLVIPNSVTSISDYAFRNWSSNNQPLVISDSVTSIRGNAFYGWSLVQYVEIQAITPPTLAYTNAFDGQNNAPIYVPDESVDDYKNATNWVKLADRIFSINDK